MLKKIKNILGIEGVKVELFLPEEVSISNGSISGQAVFTSLSDRKINSMTVRLIEKYRRGRSDSQLINEYLLGSLTLTLDMDIVKGETKKIDFELPFNMMLSEMDHLENRNVIIRRLVKLAKRLKNVRSEYKIVFEANVEGTKLNPVVTRDIQLVT